MAVGSVAVAPGIVSGVRKMRPGTTMLVVEPPDKVAKRRGPPRSYNLFREAYRVAMRVGNNKKNNI